jgi:hypothetical protein
MNTHRKKHTRLSLFSPSMRISMTATTMPIRFESNHNNTPKHPVFHLQKAPTSTSPYTKNIIASIIQWKLQSDKSTGSYTISQHQVQLVTEVPISPSIHPGSRTSPLPIIPKPRKARSRPQKPQNPSFLINKPTCMHLRAKSTRHTTVPRRKSRRKRHYLRHLNQSILSSQSQY